MDNQKSNLNHLIDPDKEGTKNRLLLDLFQGGLLNTLVKRRMRATVEKVLTEKHSQEFAANNWNHIAQMIINVHLKMNYPIYRDASTDDQIKKVKETYPLQLQLLQGVSEQIAQEKTLKQIQAKLES